MDEGDAEGWETGIVLSLGRAGQSYTRRLRGPRSYTILRDPTLLCKILHNSTKPFAHLHVSKSYSSAAILHFPAIHLKFAKTC